MTLLLERYLKQQQGCACKASKAVVHCSVARCLGMQRCRQGAAQNVRKVGEKEFLRRTQLRADGATSELAKRLY